MADFSGTIRLTGLDGVLRTLHALPPDVVSKSGGPARAALRKGAAVIAKQARANLRAVTTNNGAGTDYEVTGLLAKSIAVSRRNPKNYGVSNGEMFVVRVRREPYEDKRIRGRKLTTQDTAWMLEYGTEHQPAEPWLRPAFASTAQTAILTVESELIRRTELLAAQLLRQNGAG